MSGTRPPPPPVNQKRAPGLRPVGDRAPVGWLLVPLLVAGCAASSSPPPADLATVDAAFVSAGDLAIVDRAPLDSTLTDAAMPADAADPADADHQPTWTLLPSGTDVALNSVWGSGPNDVYVVGDSGTILHSSNGGVGWQKQACPIGNGLGSVRGTAGGGDVWIAAGISALHTTNGGKLWTMEQPPLDVGTGAVVGASVVGDDVFMVGGTNTVVHSSVNAGGLWTAIYHDGLRSRHFRGTWAAPGPRAYVCGATNYDILASGDLGMTWAVEYDELGGQTTEGLWGWPSGAELYAVGSVGLILHTLDGGKSWIAQPSGTMVGLKGVWGIDSGDVWVVGDHLTLLHSTDGGKSWQQNPTPPMDKRITFFDVWGFAPDDVYVVGDFGTILHYH